MVELEMLKKFTLAIARHESFEEFEAVHGLLSAEDCKVWNELEMEIRQMEKNGIAIDLPWDI